MIVQPLSVFLEISGMRKAVPQKTEEVTEKTSSLY